MQTLRRAGFVTLKIVNRWNRNVQGFEFLQFAPLSSVSDWARVKISSPDRKNIQWYRQRLQTKGHYQVHAADSSGDCFDRRILSWFFTIANHWIFGSLWSVQEVENTQSEHWRGFYDCTFYVILIFRFMLHSPPSPWWCHHYTHSWNFTTKFNLGKIPDEGYDAPHGFSRH